MENDPRWVLVETDEPCVQCGHCCLQFPCDLAAGHNPCLALEQRDGRYYCRLMELSWAEVADEVKEHLLVGKGCGATYMPKGLREKIPE